MLQLCTAPFNMLGKHAKTMLQSRPNNYTEVYQTKSLVAIILAIFVVKSSRVDSFKDTSFICGGGLLGLQEFKPQLFTMAIYPNPVTKKQSFSFEGDRFFVRYLKIFWPFLF